MKTHLNRPGFRLGVRCVLSVWSLLLCARLVADGALDLSFQPPDGRYGSYLSIVGGRIYGRAGTNLNRYLEDGSVDAGWRWTLPWSERYPQRLAEWPAGGVVAQYRFWDSYIDDGQGLARLLTHRTWSVITDQGYVVSAADDLGQYQWQQVFKRYGWDGIRDSGFSANNWMVGASFSGSRYSHINGCSYSVRRDSLGRTILAGLFRSCGPYERLGLARLLPNGEVDPDWNPAALLNITIGPDHYLSAMPLAIALGPDNSIVLAMYHQSDVFTWATIREDGTILWTAPLETGSMVVLVLRVQPDGCILAGGNFSEWAGQPATGLVRLKPDGTRDAGFSVTLAKSDTDSTWLSVARLELDEQGRLLLAGNFTSVNGVPRPGFARVQAFDVAMAAPTANATVTAAHVALGETLRLTAAVTGLPRPELQWYRDDEPVPGATNRGLELSVTGPADLGRFVLHASNSQGSTNLDFGVVKLALKSPRPGVLDAGYYQALPEISYVDELMTLADGRVLVCGGSSTGLTNVPQPMVLCRNPDGTADTRFGQNGVAFGNGYVDRARVLPDKRILLMGYFSEFEGKAASGLVLVDDQGKRVPVDFPVLEPPFATAALPLPDGGYVIGGLFTNVGGVSAMRLARLTPALAVDPAFQSTLLSYQVVDDLQLDSQGGILMAGYRSAAEYLTNPVPIGLTRLLPNGARDPGFTPYLGGVNAFCVEPDGTLLTSPSMVRLAPDGRLLTTFFSEGRELGWTMVVRPTDGNVFRLLIAREDHWQASDRVEVACWRPSGGRDYRYECVLPGNPVSITGLADNSILVCTMESGMNVLRRVALDSDAKLMAPGVADGRFRARLATQPGHVYEVRCSTTLPVPEDSEVVLTLNGDGYVQDIELPVKESSAFLLFQHR